MEHNFLAWLLEKYGFGKYVVPEVISIIGSLIILFIIIVLSLLAWRKLRRPENLLVPSDKFNLTNVVEIFVESFFGMVKDVLGDNAEKFFPLIGSLFVYILLCNLLGFIPGFLPPTAVIATNLACAFIVFIYYNYVGFKTKGFRRYLKDFMGPVIWLAPLLFIIELISHLIRPLSLSVRLYGNMIGDHLMVEAFSGIVPVLVPVFFMVLGVFISFLQAFIFAILSTVYISLAIVDE